MRFNKYVNDIITKIDELSMREDMNEVYMSKSLSRDLDASRKKTVNKFAIKVDGFTEEEAKTIKRANTLRAQWIRYVMRDIDRGKPSKAEAEKIVTIEEI